MQPCRLQLSPDRRRCPYRGVHRGNCCDPLRPEQVFGRRGPHSSFEGRPGLLRIGSGAEERRCERAHAASDRNCRGTLSRMAQAAARAVLGREWHAGGRRSAEPGVSSGRHWTWRCCARITSGDRFAGNTGSRALKRARYA